MEGLVSEQQQVDFERLHEDWVEKRSLLDQLVARYIAAPSEEAGMTIEMPRDALALDVLEELWPVRTRAKPGMS
jgi:hypothetical protein